MGRILKIGHPSHVASSGRSDLKHLQNTLHNPHETLTASAACCAACPRRSTGTEKNPQSKRSQSVPSGICQHIGNNLRIPDLLRGCAHQWGSMQGRVDEHRRWLLQKEVSNKDPDTAFAVSGRSGYETKRSVLNKNEPFARITLLIV